MSNVIADALDKVLSEQCDSNVIRSIQEDPGNARALWSTIQKTGLCDVLLPEEQGGAGLGLKDSFPLFELCGFYAAPIPIAETMVARALLYRAGFNMAQNDAIALASGVKTEHGGVRCSHVVNGTAADWVLVHLPEIILLLSMKSVDERLTNSNCEIELSWSGYESADMISGMTPESLFRIRALLYSCFIAGALRRILSITTSFAKERHQFGKSLVGFQVIRHNLAVMKEETEVAGAAAALGCQVHMDDVSLLPIAIAKARTWQAASTVSTLAHQTHGAIGSTLEYDLQLYSRSMRKWQQSARSAAFWETCVGDLVVNGGNVSVLDLLRDATRVRQ